MMLNVRTTRYNDGSTNSTAQRRTSKGKRKDRKKQSKKKIELSTNELKRTKKKHLAIEKQTQEVLHKSAEHSALPNILQFQSGTCTGTGTGTGCIARISQATVTLVIRVKDSNKSDKMPTYLSVNDQRALVTNVCKSASIDTDPPPSTSCSARLDRHKKDRHVKTDSSHGVKLEHVTKWCENSFRMPTLERRPSLQCVSPSRRSIQIQSVSGKNPENVVDSNEQQPQSSSFVERENATQNTGNDTQKSVTLASDSTNDEAVAKVDDSTSHLSKTLEENTTTVEKDIQNEDQASNTDASSEVSEESQLENDNEEDYESDTDSEFASDASGTLVEDWSTDSDSDSDSESESESVSKLQPELQVSNSYPRAPFRPNVAKNVLAYRRFNRMTLDPTATRDKTNTAPSTDLIHYQAHLLS